MPQFRPLPRFDELAEQDTAAFPPVDTQPVPTTDKAAAVSPDTTGKMPILLLTGPQPTLARKSPTTGVHSTLASALEASMGMPTTTTGRVVVIPADMKRKKVAAGAPIRRLQPRVRHTVILLATLTIFVVTLLTLVPLSSGQDGNSLLSSLANWIHSGQMDSQIASQINSEAFNPNPANLPPMHIPDSPYVPLAQQDALNAGISPVYFVRQINQESGFNPNAVSVTNAEGIAQFEPYTAAGLGIDPFDPVQALNGAAQMMGRYDRKYGGDYAKALGAYNAGPGAVQGAVNACGVNWLSCMPGQTQNYVYVIMGV